MQFVSRELAVGVHAAALNDIPLAALQKLELRKLVAPVLVVLETEFVNVFSVSSLV